jgi:hypothetical protein
MYLAKQPADDLLCLLKAHSCVECCARTSHKFQLRAAMDGGLQGVTLRQKVG